MSVTNLTYSSFAGRLYISVAAMAFPLSLEWVEYVKSDFIHRVKQNELPENLFCGVSSDISYNGKDH